MTPQELKVMANHAADYARQCLRFEHENEEFFRLRLVSNRFIDERLERLIAPANDRCYRALDVGAGPVTTLGTRMRNGELSVLAVDMFAGVFDAVLEEFGVSPPVRTARCHAEALSGLFAEDVFHLVHCRNAWDHMQDPLEAWRQMVRVCRPDGWVHVWCYANEGTAERGQWGHRWDVDVEGDGARITSLDTGRMTLVAGLADVAELKAERTAYRGRPVVIIEARKPA